MYLGLYFAPFSEYVRRERGFWVARILKPITAVKIFALKGGLIWLGQERLSSPKTTRYFAKD
jgi:hypothetical protein